MAAAAPGQCGHQPIVVSLHHLLGGGIALTVGLELFAVVSEWLAYREVGAGHPPGLLILLVRQRLLLLQRGAAQRLDLEGLMMAKIWDLALDIPSISPEEPPSSTALVWAAALVLLAIVLTVVLIRRDGRK